MVTTDLGVPNQPAASEPTDLIGRWNILDRGVRPLVVRSDGTFTLYDPREGRTDGRWLRVSDTFVSLFIDGPKRHSLYSMPDGQVFLSRYAPPGSVSTPELLFRSVLSFEGTWETPYRASQYVPAPPTQISLGADRTFCADLGHRDEDDSAVVVWSGIWTRTGYVSATLDYVAWVVSDGARRMDGHGYTALELHEDGTMTVAALDDVFYPAPGTVRAEGDEPLATADEPAVLLCPLAVEEPADETPEDETPEPDELVLDVTVPTPDDPSDQDSTVTSTPPKTGSAPERHPASQRDAIDTAELSPTNNPAVQRDTIDTIELSPTNQTADPATQRDTIDTADLSPTYQARWNRPVVPVARTTAEDGTLVTIVLYADTDGVLQLGALPASEDMPEPGQTVPDTTMTHVPTGLADGTAGSPLTAPPDPCETPPMLPVAGTRLADGTAVTVVLYVDENDDLQVGAIPASGPRSG